MLVGAYSSIFLATPMLSQLKDREPAIKAHTARVLARRAEGGAGTRRGTGRCRRPQPTGAGVRRRQAGAAFAQAAVAAWQGPVVVPSVHTPR
ncbi:hypothetical protein [Aeromicrobium sp. UC242_57]|uniref:hypothetical protein n=1 Tax=Aeromicrobium sp. UC242_57 TaxID=3374624 RepID=UPI00379FFABC